MNETILMKNAARVMHFLRRMNYRRQGKKLINRTPTIISNNCLGGVIYHNYGLQFRSPTINLCFDEKGFLRFVQNLKEYLNAELVEVSDRPKEFPVGELEWNGEKIKIYFMHYENFREAKEKWDERKKRVDFSNIYIIFQSVFVPESDVEAFDALPYENKMMITKSNPKNSKNVRTLDVLAKEDYVSGEILKFKSRYSLHRYMDDIDFIGFLNGKNEMLGCEKSWNKRQGR